MRYVLLIVVASLLIACGETPRTNDAPQTPVPTEQPKKVEKQSPDTELEKAFEEIAKDSKGKVGVAALVLETGQNAAFNGSEKFAMQSVYKVPIAMAVMKQIDEGKFAPDQEIEVTKADLVAPGQRSPIRDKDPNGTKMQLWRLIEFAIVESDGTASDVLLRIIGGPEVVQKYLADAKLNDIFVKNTEKELGKDVKVQYDNSATPLAMIELLKELKEPTSIGMERSKLIRDFMNESPTGPGRIRGSLPETAYAAHKTGTSGTRDGVTAATNDVGLVLLPNGNYLAIAVFVGDSSADEKTRDAVIAKITKAAWDKWGGK